MPSETALIIAWLVGEVLAPLTIAFLLPRTYRLVGLVGVGAAILAWMTYTSYSASLGGDWRPGLDSLSWSAIVALVLLLPFWLLGAGIGIWLRRRWDRRGRDSRGSASQTA
jgi:hypothetical protein